MSNDKTLLQSLAEQGKTLIAERNDAQDNEFERELSLFSAGVVSGDVPRSAVDQAIAFFKNPSAAPSASNTQLALGAGSQTAVPPTTVALRTLLDSDEIDDGYKALLRRMFTLDVTDPERFQVDDQGIPLEVTRLTKELDKVNKEKTTAEAAKKTAETKVAELEQRPNVSNAAPANTMPLDKVHTTTQQIRELLDNGKPSKALLSNKPIVTLQGDDYEKIGVALDALNPNLAKKTKDDKSKASH